MNNRSEIKDSNISLEKAVCFRENAKLKGKSFAITNGCFDLLHSGHIYSLNEISKLADYLWVMINSDFSVKKLKGNNRPIVSENDRAYILSNLKCVSGVTIFNSERLDKEILALNPDIYAKSGDYCEKSINKSEHNALIEVKAEIKFVSFLPDRSTSSLINNIRSI